MHMKLNKLRLRSKRSNFDNIPASPFNDAWHEAMAVVRKLETVRAFPACKLTAEAYLAETLTADPGASLKGVRKLRAALEQNPLPPNLTHSARSLAQMIAALKGPRWNTTPPVRYPWRLNQFGSPETTGELIRYGTSMVELFGVAIQIVDERSPDVWGTGESSAKHAAQVAALAARRDELFKQIETRASAEDLLINDDPHVPTAFKVAPEVPLAPRHDAGQRLVAYLLAQRQGS
jgi:hypothetical protein